MSMPSHFKFKRKKYIELRDLVEWYSNMPASFKGAGDRFHENVADTISQIVDENTKYDSEQYYVSHAKIHHTVLTIVFGDQDTGKDIEVQIFSEAG